MHDSPPSEPSTRVALEPKSKKLKSRIARRLRVLLRLRRLYLLRAELRFAPTEAQRLFFLTIAIGLGCGLAAVAFHLTLQVLERYLIDAATHAPGRSWIGWTIATPALGAAACGVVLQYLVPNARGSGIPQVKVSFAGQGGRLRMRDSIGKFFIGALQIGSGSSLGREGPTVQICGGLASLFGRVAGVSPKNLRRLLPVGAAAGIAAAFNAPIAAVTFTIEEVVGNLDQAVLSGVIVAAALSAVIERSILEAPTTVPQEFGIHHASSLLVCLVIGIAAAAVSLTFTTSLLRLRARFRDMSLLPPWLRPAVGGLATGILAVVALWVFHTRGVTGGGYATLGQALAGDLTLRIMLVLCAMKVVATVLAYASGGAGGIFAPALFIGGMLGGSVGILCRDVMHTVNEPIGIFALVGMGAVFAGIIRAPMTSVLIIVEMTGGYSLILPLMIANMTAYALARRWSPMPIYEALLKQDGVVLSAHAPPDALEGVRVSELLQADQEFLRFSPVTPANDVLKTSRESHPQDVYPVIDGTGRYLGVITTDELTILSSEPDLIPLTNAADLMRPPMSVRPQDEVRAALTEMVASGVREMPVVDETGIVVGLVDEAAFAKAYLSARLQENPVDRDGLANQES